MEVVQQEQALRRTVEWQWANPIETYDPKEFDYAAEDAALATFEKPWNIRRLPSPKSKTKLPKRSTPKDGGQYFGSLF